MNNKFLEKLLPMILRDDHSEKLLAQLRFALALVGAIFSGYLLIIDKITFVICLIQICSLSVVGINSTMYLFEPKKKSYSGHTYINSFFDIIIISIYILTLYQSGMSIQWIHNILFPFYFIIVVLTTLHNKSYLALATGLISFFVYSSILLIILISQNLFNAALLFFYGPSLVTLLIVSFICTLFSHKNTQLKTKLIDVEKRFNNMSNTLPSILFKIDMDGKIVWIHTTSNIKPAVSKSRLMGKKIQDFLIDPDCFKIDGTPIQGTFKVKGIHEKIEYVDCLISKPDVNNNPTILEGNMTDVTAREKAVFQKKEMEKQLFQYKKMESLGTLASGMAHDFNNILQTITDITEEVQSKTNELYTSQRMNQISETLIDARFLISELLSMDRKKSLDHAPLDIIQFLHEIISEYSQQLGEHYNINLNIIDDSIWIHGDKDYLKRVFQNFFGNSKDAMPEGGTISVDCSIKINNSSQKLAVICFSDTGVGVPKKIADKIFDPFFTTKKKGKGTGLGLAFVKRIITLHKGQIFLENTYPNGTTFRIEIPECSEYIEDIDFEPIQINRQSTCLLILDDDPKMRKILSFFLSELSYNTYETSSVDEGIMILKKNSGDIKILIMDWKLGDHDPHDVIRRYREIIPSLIIIVVSGFQSIKKSVEEMNIYKWITKPYDKNYLDNEIQKALNLYEKINI